MAANGSDDIWVIFRLREKLYGVGASFVREMTALPEITRVPQASPHVRGVINLRGQVLTTVDLRSLLNLGSAAKEAHEFIEMLKQREQDHLNWVSELEKSVQEKREFRLTTDPHACAFGKWHDSYKTDNHMISAILEKFAKPHAAIHQLGIDACHLCKEGRGEEAQHAIELSKTHTLRALLDLFESLRNALGAGRREIGLVVNVGGTSGVLVVDAVESVEHINPESIDQMSTVMGDWGGKLLDKIAKRSSDQSLVVLMDAAKILACVDSATVVKKAA